jgi:hypothetical protein
MSIARLSRATKCRGCGKDICFIKTKNGKSMPVDPEPVEFQPEAAFDRFVMMDGTVERGLAVVMAYGIETKIGYRSHFSTCPAADDFRKKKNKSERTRQAAEE